jgi:mannose-6-phosphate isomerase-like protein (cupin superfamily)
MPMADFVMKRWDLKPYPGDQAPPHIHHGSDEAFYVIDGTLEVLVGTERRRLEAGEFVIIPAGTAHTFANRGPSDTTVLAVMTPEVDELVQALHGGLGPTEQAQVWSRYRSSLVSGQE